MTLKVIDISDFQTVEIAGSTDADAVIVKATQGVSYVSPKANAQYQLAKSKGKLLGFYHYAGGGNATAEADYFYAKTKNYFKEAIPVLDWEQGQNAAWGNGAWALTFINRIKALTGVTPLIYTGSDGVTQTGKYLANVSGLWFAGYPDLRSSWNAPNFPYSTGAWKSLTGWQFTDSNGTLDRSIFYLDAKAWNKIANPGGAGATKPVAPTKPASPASFVDTLGDKWIYAKGTLQIKVNTNLRWGARVNSALITTLPAGSKVTYDAYSDHGGYRWVRQPRASGYAYLATGPVGDTLAYVKSGAAHTYYSVVSGDSLWAIAQQYGTTVDKLCSLNGISQNHVIHPNDKLIVN